MGQIPLRILSLRYYIVKSGVSVKIWGEHLWAEKWNRADFWWKEEGTWKSKVLENRWLEMATAFLIKEYL